MRQGKALLLALVACVVLANCATTHRLVPREGFLNVPGGPVWFRVVGTASSTPLLILHGGPGVGSCRLSALAALGDQRSIVFYDQLGSGRSGRPADSNLWHIDRFVEELDAVRKQLGLSRIHLLGHSWGGALAVQYLLTKGTRGVESLILAGPLLSTRDWIDDANVLRRQLPMPVQEVLKRNEDAGTTHSPEYEEATQVFYSRFLYHRQPVPVTPECAGSASNQVIYETMWGPTEFYATGNLRNFDVTSRLGELHLPVLLVVGRFDEARPETVGRYQKQIGGSQLEVIEDAGHVSMVDEPQRFLEVVRRFMTTVAR